MRRTRHRFAVGAARLLPDAVTKLGSALLRHAQPRNRKQELLGSASRRLFFETLEPRVLLSADVLPISGSIAVPGETDRYAFTLTKETQLLFDSQTNSSQLSWSLDGPRGNVVSSRSFSSSDPVDVFNGVAPLDLVSGSYTLSVQGLVDATGNYQFRLLDLADASAITPGTPVSGTLNPGNETDLYQFSANPGDKFYFDQQSLSGQISSTEWRLLDPFERTVWSTNLGSDVQTQSLQFAGTYTLLIEGGVGNTSSTSYGFNVQPVTSPTTTLTLGTQVNGSISQIGQQNLYTFSLANASQLYFDSLTNDSSLNWTLTGPRGTEVGGRGFTSSDSVDVSGSPALSLVAGNYTLSVAANGEHTVNYSFRLSNLASAAVLTPGTAVAGSLSGGTASNLYQFNAQAGDQFYFDAQNLTGSTSNTYWRLTDPYGQQVWANNFFDVGPRSLTASGTYTLLVEGRVFNTSQIDYTFNAQKLTNTTAALTLGTQVNGAITQPGQQAAYTFTLANSRQLYFDSLTNDNSLNWTLTGPRGTEVTSRSFTASDG
jgi:hypothetical protein